MLLAMPEYVPDTVVARLETAMDEQTTLKSAEMVVKGGPPPPTRHCECCGKPLMGHPSHRMDSDGKLYCDDVCWVEYAQQGPRR